MSAPEDSRTPSEKLDLQYQFIIYETQDERFFVQLTEEIVEKERNWLIELLKKDPDFLKVEEIKFKFQNVTEEVIEVVIKKESLKKKPSNEKESISDKLRSTLRILGSYRKTLEQLPTSFFPGPPTIEDPTI